MGRIVEQDTLVNCGLEGKTMLQIKQYVKAQSLDEAYELNQKKSNVIVGGMQPTYRNDNGILILNIFDFLLNKVTI